MVSEQEKDGFDLGYGGSVSTPATPPTAPSSQDYAIARQLEAQLKMNELR